jgi:regulator of cell morphogenesis and NO signaling
MISKEMPMGRAVLDHIQLLPLLSRFQIPLGFGERSVGEVCEEHSVNPDFFLEIANTYLNPDEAEREDNLAQYPLSDMVSYLRATHSYYLDVAMPRLERQLDLLLSNSDLNDKEIKLLKGFFNDYREDFLVHISLEEKEILPYILELERQSLMDPPDTPFLEQLQHYSISNFAQEHDRLEYSLENLSKLLIKYLPPFQDQERCIRLLRELAELVKDLADHADMEDKLLIPMVAALEEQLQERAGAK